MTAPTCGRCADGVIRGEDTDGDRRCPDCEALRATALARVFAAAMRDEGRPLDAAEIWDDLAESDECFGERAILRAVAVVKDDEEAAA